MFVIKPLGSITIAKLRHFSFFIHQYVQFFLNKMFVFNLLLVIRKVAI